MRQEDGGDAIAEFEVEGFVVPQVHAQPCAKAAANEGEEQQGGFWDAPTVVSGLQFVEAVGEEREGIDGEEVAEDEVRVHGGLTFDCKDTKSWQIIIVV